MGYSPSATLTWGIRLGDDDNMPDCFYSDTESGDLKWDDYEFEQTLEEKFPLVELDFGFSYDWTSRWLTVKSTKISDYEGECAVNLSALVPPTEEELSQLNGWLDFLGYDGLREVKLYMFAFYG